MGIFNGILTSQCNEINLYSDSKEYACCVLSSLPIGKYIDYIEDKPVYNYEKLGETARFIVRTLNEVIDLNDYPVIETKISNFRHRPLGIGV
jgi:ribonucleotide reductase alpha subunit